MKRIKILAVVVLSIFMLGTMAFAEGEAKPAAMQTKLFGGMLFHSQVNMPGNTQAQKATSYIRAILKGKTAYKDYIANYLIWFQTALGDA